MNALSHIGRLAAVLLTLTFLLAACAAGGQAPSEPPATAPSAAPSVAPDAPVTAPPVDPSVEPPTGARLVLPKPGRAIDVHPVPAEQLSARVDGNTIVVQAMWTSGVEPCTILDSIVVDRGENRFTVTLREGSSPQEIACIAIAEQHMTEFRIPDVPAGTWTIADSGGIAPPVEVKVG